MNTSSNTSNNRCETGKMPVLFIGHGSPLNAIDNNEFSLSWEQMGRSLPVPKAVLCISAHWETNGTRVCASPNPPTIHDFIGFPKSLFRKTYPVAGAPDFAKLTADAVTKTKVELDTDRGLDHGCWSVFSRLFPEANIPVFQLSIDYTKPPSWHYALASELISLRYKGVLIAGSGNIVHNLRLMRKNNAAYNWAGAFDEQIKNCITASDHQSVVAYNKMGAMADLSVPTHEHFIPLLYALAVREKNEPVSFFNEKTVFGSVSMRSLKFG